MEAKMNRHFIKVLDATFGCLVVSILPAPSVHNDYLPPMSSVLLIRPGGIGDAVLIAPTVNLLKKNYPNLHITILAEQRNAGVLPLVSGVDKVLCYDIPKEFIQALRGQYDAVIDTEQMHRLSAVVARFSSAPMKIGFDTNERRRMFTHYISYSQDDYEAISFVHLLQPLGMGLSAVALGTPFLSIPCAASAKTTGFLKSCHNKPFVIVFPGASIQERRWGSDRFRQVAEILSTFGVNIVVVGGKEDRQQGDLIAGGGLGINLAGLTSLAETAAVIQKSALLVSGDSGVLHIAAGLGIPTVSLFGPGRAKKWAPRGDHHIVINKELSCSPCTVFGNTPPCPNNIRCMSDITVDEVVNAVNMLLTSVGKIPSVCCRRGWIEAV